jgi:hypothetical protein
MAPHDTNTRKEARRHAVPLIVMGVGVALAVIGLIWWLGWVFAEAPQTPVTDDPQQIEQEPGY